MLLRGFDQFLRCVPLTIPFPEQFGANDAFLINQKRSWVRNPFGPTACPFIEDTKCSDGFAVFVGEKWKFHFGFRCELCKDFHRIVTDCDHLQICFFELPAVLLQLNQLPNAERSPGRRSMEDHRNGTFFEQILERLLFPILILEGELRSGLAHFHSGFLLRGSHTECDSQTQNAETDDVAKHF